MLMYIITLGYLFSMFEFLEKIIYKGWLGASTIFLPSSDDELKIV